MVVQVIIALLLGYMVAAVVTSDGGKHYVTSSDFSTAPSITFLWVKTFGFGFYAPAVLPFLIGNLTYKLTCLAFSSCHSSFDQRGSSATTFHPLPNTPLLDPTSPELPAKTWGWKLWCPEGPLGVPLTNRLPPGLSPCSLAASQADPAIFPLPYSLLPFLPPHCLESSYAVCV